MTQKRLDKELNYHVKTPLNYLFSLQNNFTAVVQNENKHNITHMRKTDTLICK
jgi:hypothetical protein